MELLGKGPLLRGRNYRLVNNFIKIVSRSCLSNYFSLDLLDTQNVYSFFNHFARESVIGGFNLEYGNIADAWKSGNIEISNIVFPFSKTSCSTEYDKKKCMGNTRSDQFNSKFTLRQNKARQQKYKSRDEKGALFLLTRITFRDVSKIRCK